MVRAGLRAFAPVAARALPELERPRVDAVLAIVLVHQVQVVVVFRVVPTIILLQPFAVYYVVMNVVPGGTVVVIKPLRPYSVANKSATVRKACIQAVSRFAFSRSQSVTGSRWNSL